MIEFILYALVVLSPYLAVGFVGMVIAVIVAHIIIELID